MKAVAVFGFAYLLIAIGRIPPVLVAVFGAVAMVVSGVITEQQALCYVDLEVILLLAAMTSLVVMAPDPSGRLAALGRSSAWDLRVILRGSC